MNAETWGLVATMVVISCGWLELVRRMWVLRSDFEIAARSPRLVCVSGVAALGLVMSVLLHWLLLSERRSLPCVGIFWVSYLAYAFCDTPYLIRAVRLVVAYNKDHRRYKLARFVKWKPLMIVWAVTNVGLGVRAALFFGRRPSHTSRDARECYYFDDVILLGLALAFTGGPAIVLARNLLQVNDAFFIRQELERVIGLCCVCGGTIAALQVVVMFGLLPDSRWVHFVVEVLTFLFGANAGVWGLFVPISRHEKWFGHGPGGAVLPVEGSDRAGFDGDIHGVLDLAMKGGPISERFGLFCRANLCMESWDFIVEAVHYENMAATELHEQFDVFHRILVQYLLPTSPDEVNICSAMSKRMASFGTREAFGARLDQDGRHDILKEPLNEISRMLEQNLLAKFRQHAVKQQDMEFAEAAQGDKELMDLMQFSSRPASNRSSRG